jgi:hypothetical protein
MKYILFFLSIYLTAVERTNCQEEFILEDEFQLCVPQNNIFLFFYEFIFII